MKTKKQKNDVAASFRTHGSNVNNFIISSKKYCIYFTKNVGFVSLLTDVRAVVALSLNTIMRKCQALKFAIHFSLFTSHFSLFTYNF